MNQQYHGDHVDSLLDHANDLAKENEELRQFLIASLRVLQRPEVYEVLTDGERITGAGIQAFLAPRVVPYSELVAGDVSA